MQNEASRPKYSKSGVAFMTILLAVMAGALVIGLGGIQGAWFRWSVTHSTGSAATIVFLIVGAGWLVMAISSMLWGVVKWFISAKHRLD